MKLCFEKLEAAWVPWVLIGGVFGSLLTLL